MDKSWWWERYRFLLVLVLLGIRRLMPESSARDVLAIVILMMFAAEVLWSLRVGFVRRRPFWSARSWRRGLLIVGVPMLMLAAVVLLPAIVDVSELAGPRSSPSGKMIRAALLLVGVFGFLGSAFGLIWFKDGRPDKQVEWPQLRVRPTPQP